MRPDNAKGRAAHGRPAPSLTSAAAKRAEVISTVAQARDIGWVTLAEIARASGGRAEALRALAELLAAGYLRSAIGPVPGDYAGRLVIADGDDELTFLLAMPPSCQPLADDRTEHLLRVLDEIPGISLGAVVLVHAGLRIGHPGDGGPTFDSDELEDYLGASRGSLADM